MMMSDFTSLLHFDGINGSQVFTDESGKTWRVLGSTQISNISPKFGSGSGHFTSSSGF